VRSDCCKTTPHRSGSAGCVVHGPGVLRRA